MRRKAMNAAAAVTAAALLAAVVPADVYADDSGQPLLRETPCLCETTSSEEENISLEESNEKGDIGSADSSDGSDVIYKMLTRVETVDETGALHSYITDEDGNIIIPTEYKLDDFQNGLDSEPLPSRYSLWEQGRVTPVKNQRNFGFCWAYAAMSAMESSMITKGLAGTNTDYAERALVWYAMSAAVSNPNNTMYSDCSGYYIDSSNKTVKQPLGTDIYKSVGSMYFGGSSNDAIAALASWMGPDLQENVPEYETTGLLEENRFISHAHLQNASFLKTAAEVKQAIMENGAVSAAYYNNNKYSTVLQEGGYTYYNPNYEKSLGTNHLISIVGWDDNYSASKFSGAPSSDGAWIIKNSWGDSSDPYMISYEESSLCAFASFDAYSADNYDDIYSFDGDKPVKYFYLPAGSASQFGLSNTFASRKDSLLRAVGITTVTDSFEYTLKIYRNVQGAPDTGTCVLTQSGSIPRAGFHTIDLDESIPLSEGEFFSVLFYTQRPSTDYFAADDDLYSYPDSGIKTAYYYSDSGFKEFSVNPAIKAYTTDTGEKPSLVEAPTGLDVSEGCGKVQLSWYALPGADKYRVYTFLNGKYKGIGNTTKTSYTVNDLESGVRYGFAVKAYYGDTLSDYSEKIYAVPKPEPQKPSGLYASSGNGCVTVSWQAPGGADKYRVYTYLNGKYKGIGNTTKTSYTVKGLQNGVKCGFAVKAYYGSELSEYSAVVYAAPSAVYIAKPAKLTAESGDKNVTLSWRPTGSADKYKVYSADNEKYTLIGETANTRFTVNNLENGRKYSFAVKACCGTLLSGYSSTAVCAPLPKITGLTAVSGINQVGISWKAASGADKYRVYAFADGKYTGIGNTTKTSYTVKDLTNNKKYGFAVKAYRGDMLSGYSSIVYCTPLPKASGVKVSGANGSAKLTWNAAPGADKYRVYYYIDGKYTGVGNTTKTSYTVSGLTSGREYGFAVRAYYGDDISGYCKAAFAYVDVTRSIRLSAS